MRGTLHYCLCSKAQSTKNNKNNVENSLFLKLLFLFSTLVDSTTTAPPPVKLINHISFISKSVTTSLSYCDICSLNSRGKLTVVMVDMLADTEIHNMQFQRFGAAHPTQYLTSFLFQHFHIIQSGTEGL